MNESQEIFVDEEKIRESIEKDPFLMLIFATIFFGFSDWEIPQNEKIQEMMENTNGQ